MWQAEYDAKLRELEEKIPAYNDRVHEANRRIEFEDYYLYVSKKKTIAPTLLSTAPGTIQSGGDLLLDTDTLNKDSAIQAGGIKGCRRESVQYKHGSEIGNTPLEYGDLQRSRPCGDGVQTQPAQPSPR